LAIFFWGGDGASIGGFAAFFEGGPGKNRFFAWCFGGEFVVECVTMVDLRHHVVWSLKTCHYFEIYFRVGCGKARDGVALGIVHEGTERYPIPGADLRA
jgi:hypothetical protein